jgi:hypothetical protein
MNIDRLSIIKRHSSRDLQKLYLHFDSVYKNPDCQKSFQKHLEEEFNTEPFEFCLLAEKFNKLKDEKEKLTLFFKIYEGYLATNSEKEINLSGDIKATFHKNFQEQLESKDKWIVPEETEIFERIKKNVESQLYHDVFPRFRRTEQCLKLLEKYQNDTNLCEMKEVRDFPYTDEDFQIEIVTDKDIGLLDRLMEDTYDWKLLFSDRKAKMNSYYMKKCFFPNVSFFKNSRVHKFESIVPFGMDQCIEALCSISQTIKSDEALEYIDCLSYLTPEESLKKYPDLLTTKRANGIFDAILIIPMMIPRKALDVVTTYIDKNGSWIRVIKPKIPDYINSPKDWDKSHQSEIGGNLMKYHLSPNLLRFQLTPVSETETKYTYVHIFQMYGNLLVKHIDNQLVICLFCFD